MLTMAKEKLSVHFLEEFGSQVYVRLSCVVTILGPDLRKLLAFIL